MKRHWRWLALLLPLVAGIWRLRLDVEPLDLLPPNLPAVRGLKLYQQHFSNARELILAIRSPAPATAEAAAKAIAEDLRRETDLVAQVLWQAPWMEHPEQTAELIAHLWLNQPPEVFAQLGRGLDPSKLPAVITATREELAVTLSPMDIARLGYDPFGLTRLPESVAGAAPGFDGGSGGFASKDGNFRLIFITARPELKGYQECTSWLEAVKSRVVATGAREGWKPGDVSIGYTGRPAFVAEISASMRHDMIVSAGGTFVIIASLFWLAHRRVKPMLWLLALLGMILVATIALGGLVFGTLNVVSLGFAAILLGLAVDYAVVHYQEALAQPELSVPEIRRGIAPSIFWAAVTTICAFLTLNLGGLPGLGQLGSLVGIGVALSALVMIFAFLPPLFPGRRVARPVNAGPSAMAAAAAPRTFHPAEPAYVVRSLAATLILLGVAAALLLRGGPAIDSTAAALQPRESQAYATLEAVTKNFSDRRDPLTLIVSGKDEAEVARRLAALEPKLQEAVSNGLLSSYAVPTALWPRPDFQEANRPVARKLASEREAMRAAAVAGGFSAEAMGLADKVLDTWTRAAASRGAFWPTNDFCEWLLSRMASRSPGEFYAAGLLTTPTNVPDAAGIPEKLARSAEAEGVTISSWEMLGRALLGVVRGNLWRLVTPMCGLVFLSLWFAFRRSTEILLGLGVLLLSGLGLLAVMKAAGWSWNLLNLMAVPLLLGTGVDYSIFMQLALRRHDGDPRAARASVGRALILCGGAAAAGFGSLGFSINEGMASMGRVCAVGVGFNMLIAVYLLPAWWKLFERIDKGEARPDRPAPSSLYRAGWWSAGLAVARVAPVSASRLGARAVAGVYYLLAGARRETVVENLLPAVGDDLAAARKAGRALFKEFAIKLADLWRLESGGPTGSWQTRWSGWEHFETARAAGRGVLLVTPHLGNWEFGGALLAGAGVGLTVLTQAEPGRGLTEMRQASRARRGIETVVVGEDPFAFVEIIKRLQEGAVVALLVDRPPPGNGVEVRLFGRPFTASTAAADLARAAGCAIVPVFVVRSGDGYEARVLPEVGYQRSAIGNRSARVELTGEIVRAFEPFIRQHPSQWYHFVPIWPRKGAG